jgi:hypothetical protein
MAGERGIFEAGRKSMGKKVYYVNGNYYIIDDKIKKIKKVIIQDDTNIPQDDLKQLVNLLAENLAEYESQENG